MELIKIITLLMICKQLGASDLWVAIMIVLAFATYQIELWKEGKK